MVRCIVPCIHLIIDTVGNIIMPDCYFKVKYGLYCPGCGGTRSVIALLHGDLMQSIYLNPLPTILVLDFIILSICYIYEHSANKKYATAQFRLALNVGILFIVLAFTIMRNVLLVSFGIDMLGDIRTP